MCAGSCISHSLIRLCVLTSLLASYSNIFVTSPSPENLKTLFEFILNGLSAIGYKEHLDYSIVQVRAYRYAVVQVLCLNSFGFLINGMPNVVIGN